MKTAEELIKIILDNQLQKFLFDGEDYDFEYEDEFEDDDAFVASLGLKNFKKVADRQDSSEFWAIIHFKDEDIYLRLEGWYDSYGQYEHEYYNNIKQVYPKTVSTIIYE